MWTESRNPNTAPLMARPQSLATNAHPSAVFAVNVAKTGCASKIDMPWLSSGGKEIPKGGQEHPRTEL
jgi:hypothetical protein